MTKKLQLIMLLSIFIACLQVAVGGEAKSMVFEHSLTGKEALAISIAVEEMKKRGIDPLGYEVSLYRYGKEYVVFLDDPKVGRGDKRSGIFEVRIDEALRVVPLR